VKLDGLAVTKILNEFAAALVAVPEDAAAVDVLSDFVAAHSSAVFDLRTLAASGVATAGSPSALEERLRKALARRFAAGVWT
jgi:hypothetical protein